MKSFSEYLLESRKSYSFKIGVAGEKSDHFEEHMEECLKKFGLVKLSTGKRTPIQERPLDFPQLQNTEVTYYEVELSYPTTQQVLKEYIGKCCTVHESNIIVRDPNEPLERYQAEASDAPYETKLTTEELPSESAQDSVGENRVMSLLKELEKARKEQTEGN